MASGTSQGSRARLGRTGYEISRLGFGTVELGMSYGLPAREGMPSPPADEQAVALLHAAFEAGVDFVDTAPGYGRSEELVGRALRSWTGPAPVVATKVACPSAEQLANPEGLAEAVSRSVDASRRALGRDHLQLLQVHNATEEALRSAPFAAALQATVEDGRVAFVGASTYGPEAAREAIASGWCATIQLAYSVLDQQPAAAVIREAAAHDVGVIARSVLLKGVLGVEADALPEGLRPLGVAVTAVREVAAADDESVAATCVRFVLSHPDVSTAILGIDRPAFLAEDVSAWRSGPLDDAVLARLAGLHVGGDATDPRTWGF